jgi:hypothetical protein
MHYKRILFVLSLIVIFTAGCKKSSADSVCEKLKNAMITNNVDQAKVAITLFINSLPTKQYTAENLQRLATTITRECGIRADVSCFDCIDSYPGQSEIRLTIIGAPSPTAKSIDLSHALSDNNMKVLNMHD